MLDDVRNAFRELLSRSGGSAEDRRSALPQMKETLVLARMGLDDLRKSLDVTRRRLEGERRELETVRRRKQLAEGIKDAETVTLAERFERQHEEKVQVLARKLETQEAELAIAEREVAEMTAELKAANAGIPGPGMRPVAAPMEDPLDDGTAAAGEEIDGMARANRRAAREADAEERLAELKRRMGK